MDLLGDIVEKDPYGDNGNNTSNNDDLQIKYNKTGFPELYKPEKISSWKQRLREKKMKKKKDKKDEKDQDLKRTEAISNDADAIHLENLKYMENMSEEQILREKAELLSSLNPKLVQSLLKRIDARVGAQNSGESGTVNTTTDDQFDTRKQDQRLFEGFEVEGAPGTWVGGYNNLNLQGLPKLDNEQISKYLRDEAPDDTQKKTVHFDVEEEEEEEEKEEVNTISDNDNLDDDDDADDIAPLDYQMAEAIDHMSNEELLRDVHFVKPDTKEYEPLDINDPDFNEKLHEKYFPDLPRDIEKLKWMQPVDDNGNDASNEVIIEDVSQCRFDFDGNLVPPNRKVKSTTHSGLHHHADDPQLAGYTLVELDHLARSTFPAQRCMAIQTLGRILYKLGKQSYSNQLVPEVDAETFEKENESDPKRVMDKIYAMFWDLIIDLKLIEMLELSTSEKFSKSLSVRSYATDALWLWRQGGGDYRKVK